MTDEKTKEKCGDSVVKEVRWIDDLQFYVLLNSISVITG